MPLHLESEIPEILEQSEDGGRDGSTSRRSLSGQALAGSTQRWESGCSCDWKWGTANPNRFGVGKYSRL